MSRFTAVALCAVPEPYATVSERDLYESVESDLEDYLDKYGQEGDSFEMELLVSKNHLTLFEDNGPWRVEHDLLQACNDRMSLMYKLAWGELLQRFGLSTSGMQTSPQKALNRILVDVPDKLIAAYREKRLQPVPTLPLPSPLPFGEQDYARSRQATAFELFVNSLRELQPPFMPYVPVRDFYPAIDLTRGSDQPHAAVVVTFKL